MAAFVTTGRAGAAQILSVEARRARLEGAPDLPGLRCSRWLIAIVGLMSYPSGRSPVDVGHQRAERIEGDDPLGNRPTADATYDLGGRCR